MTPEALDVPNFASLDRRADAFLDFFGEELFPRIGALRRGLAGRPSAR